MVAMNKYTLDYVKSLLAATPAEQLVEPSRPKRVKGVTDEQMGLMERNPSISSASSRLPRNPTGTTISILSSSMDTSPNSSATPGW